MPREPAWHHRARQQRAAARNLVRASKGLALSEVQRARKLLGGHHGSSAGNMPAWKKTGRSDVGRPVQSARPANSGSGMAGSRLSSAAGDVAHHGQGRKRSGRHYREAPRAPRQHPRVFRAMGILLLLFNWLPTYASTRESLRQPPDGSMMLSRGKLLPKQRSLPRSQTQSWSPLCKPGPQWMQNWPDITRRSGRIAPGEPDWRSCTAKLMNMA